MRIAPLIAALASASSSASSSADSLSYEEAVKTIRHDLSLHYSQSAEEPLCHTYSCCNVTASESCGLTAMPRDETTLVLPGGDTRCIFSYSTPFAFQVVPGNSDQLMFYFQGGGACWDEASTKAQLCTTDCVPNKPNGVFDRGEELNAYKDYTIVHVMYCSGDIHGGNSERPYKDDAGENVQQKGLINTQSALDWVLQQQENGGLASKLSSLVITGCSAGSLGAQLWYDQLVHQLNWDTVAVIPDSYAGVFPDGAIGPLFYDYNFCSSGFLSDALYAKCMRKELTNMDVMSEYLAKSPSVPVAYLQSKTDTVQMSFYVSLGLTTPNTTAAITPSEFYRDVNDIFELYNKFPSFMTYLVDGQQHCFTPSSKYFTADTISATDDGASTSETMMYAWTGSMPLQDGENLSTVCEGNIEDPEASHDDQTYCADSLIPKEFVEDFGQ